MDENRVPAMSAALLSLGERAAEGLGRGELSQVYVEGESGTVFLISAEDEAVLVAVGAPGAKVGLLLYEIRRAAAEVGATLKGIEDAPEPVVEIDEAELEAWRPRPVEVPVTVPTEIVSEAPVLTVVPQDLDEDGPVVDEADPLGLGDLEPVDHEENLVEASFVDEGPEDTAQDTPEDSDSWTEPKADLGAWATFAPGATNTNNESSWS